MKLATLNQNSSNLRQLTGQARHATGYGTRHLIQAARGLCLWVLLLLGASAGHAQTGQLLFDEEFNTAIDTSVWNVHDGTWNIQRTKFGKAPTIVTENGTTFARFGLDTYNPNDPGNTILGTEMWSNQHFSMGTGVDFQARIRGTNVPSGAVQSFFTYKQRNFSTDHDQEEIDYEFLGKQFQTNQNQLWLNIWNNTSSYSSSPQASGMNNNSWATWNTYDIIWLNDRVEWRVNGNLVRTETNLMPDTYMSLCFNLWAATADWSNAYDGNLLTATSAAASKNYYFDVDYIKVYSIPPASNFTGAVGNGTGLSGTFFNDTALTNYVFSELSPRINYNWGSNSPDPNSDSGSYNWSQWSARWSGQVQAQYSEPYTFSAKAEDGVRLYVNNQLIINNWQNQSGGATTTSGTINLTAGQWYDIRMEFYSSTGNATAQLFWSSPSTPKQLVPDTQLAPYTATPTFNVAAGTYYTPQTITISDATVGADIHYTLDGTTPTRSSAQIASGASLTLSSTTTLKAGAWHNDYYASPINNTAYTIINDTIPPTIAVSSPITTYSYTSLTSANGTASDSGGSGLQSVTGRLYRYSDNTYWNGGAWIGAAVELPTTGTATWTLNLPALTDGHYALRATARDMAGNTAAASIVDFYIDTIPPTATVAAPTAMAFKSLGQAAGTATDVGPGVAQVTGRLFRYADGTYWNGGAWAAAPADVVATGTSSWSLPLPPLGDGKYAFSAAASDYAGNKAATTAFDFFIDSTPPTATLSSLPFNSSFRNLAQVTGTASDALSGVAQTRGRLYRYADGAFWNGAAWVGIDTDSPAQGTTSWAFSLPALADGKYSFRADALDAAGNIGYSSASDFSIDNVPPTVTVTSPLVNSLLTGTVVAGGTASDAVPGVQQVNCGLLRYADNAYWNGTAWTLTPSTVVASGTTNWTLSLPALGDGKYALIASAGDVLGNASAPIAVDFLVDATPPSVTISVPANNAIVTSVPSLTGAAQDNLSGVSAVALLLQRSQDGLYWNGFAWSGTPTYLAATLSNQSNNVTWVLGSGLPSGVNLPDGGYVLTASAADGTAVGGAAGNGRGTTTQSFTVLTAKPTPLPTLTPVPTIADNTAPTVSFTSIKQGAVVKTLSYVVGQAADNSGGSGVARVDLVIQRSRDRKYWNGAAWVSAVTRLTTTLGSGNWARRTGLPTSANLSAGKYNLQAIAQDRAGNARSAAIIITVGQLAPLNLKWVWPGSGATLTSLTYVAGQVGGDGIARVDVTCQRGSDSKYWNGRAWAANSVALTTTLAGGNWARRTGLPQGTDLAAGAYALQATAYSQTGSKLTVALAITVKGATPTPVPTPTPAGPVSTVRLSTSTATSGTGSIALHFTGALDANLASDPAHFQVTIRGQVVAPESAAYVATTHTILLSLPEGALHAGDHVTAQWQGLRDAAGRSMATTTSLALAQ